eukprot:m.129221 g.129221  ORF g.129221 m.129221 type:complete len:185 (-) comp14574_c0_seq6:1258-1812(-)
MIHVRPTAQPWVFCTLVISILSTILTVTLMATYMRMQDKYGQLQAQSSEYERILSLGRDCEHKVIEVKEVLKHAKLAVVSEKEAHPEQQAELRDNLEKCHLKISSAEAELEYSESNVRLLKMKLNEKLEAEMKNISIRNAYAYLSETPRLLTNSMTPDDIRVRASIFDCCVKQIAADEVYKDTL